MKFQRPPFRNRGFERTKPNDRHPEPPDHRAHTGEDEEPEGAAKRESEYLRGLTEAHTPIMVHLKSGEVFNGYIEYYDRNFIRLTREGEPNLFIYKHDIKYLSEA